jgi:hypothetical protein
MRAFERISESHRELIEKQKIFFVASAPLAADGHVNVSPKGLDSLAVLDENRVAYLDLGGSGIETHAHMLENGRLCIMFCAFEGDPKILRLYGRGQAHAFGTTGFDELRSHFRTIEVPVRGIIDLRVSRVQESCGWGVPLYEFKGFRDRLLEHNASRTQEEYLERRYRSNGQSIDGLPGLQRP